MKVNVKQIVFTKINTAELIDHGVVDFSDLGDHDVVIRNVYTTISCGTERANITGDLNVSDVIQTTPQFPRASGYNNAGVVVKVGKEVKSVKVGDRVVAYWGQHRNYRVTQENMVVKMPDNVSMQDGALSFISTFPLAAIRKTNLEIGEPAIVVGLGILGQIAIRLLKAGGAAPVVAIDPIQERREEALLGGADYAFDPTEEGFAEKVKEVTSGGANVAIEVTGLGAGLNTALDCMAKFGRVALLGCTRNKDFTIDYYRKVHIPGITLVGAHTNARNHDATFHGNYTHADDIRATLKLLSLGRMNFNGLIKEVHTPEECPEVYTRLVEDKNFPIGVQFKWSEE